MSNQHPRGSFSSAGPADNEVDSEDDVVDTKSGKGKDGEKADRKGIINRVNSEYNTASLAVVQLANTLTMRRSLCELDRRVHILSWWH